MSNLVVLAEIDCLDLLQANGVMPQHYFTDFDKFKESSFIFSNAIIVCIFAGTCAFSKRRVLEELEHLIKISQENDFSNVEDIYILSDSTLPRCNKYYKYTTSIFKVVEHNKERAVGSVKNLFDKLTYDKVPENACRAVYSAFDKSDATEAIQAVEKQVNQRDILQDVIKIPDIRELFD